MFPDWLRMYYLLESIRAIRFYSAYMVNDGSRPPNRTVWVGAQFPFFPALYIHNSQVKRR